MKDRATVFSIFANRDLRNTMFGYLNLQEAGRVATAFYVHDNPNIKKEELREYAQPAFMDSVRRVAKRNLKNAVLAADWKYLERVITKYPDLMFERFTSMINGHEMQTSVLEYACYVRDRYTLDICKHASRPEHQEGYKNIVLSYTIMGSIPTHDETLAEDGYATFMAIVDRWVKNDKINPVSIDDLRAYLIEKTHQMSQRDQVYSLQPFYWACEAFVAILQRRLDDDPDVSNDTLYLFLQKIDGFAKRYLLPTHMRKQMQAYTSFDGKFRWCKTSYFDEYQYPDGSYVQGFRKSHDYVNPDSNDDPDYIFGENYSLIRANSIFGCNTVNWLGPCGSWHDDAREDIEIFRHLDEVRRTQYISEQSYLNRQNEQHMDPAIMCIKI